MNIAQISDTAKAKASAAFAAVTPSEESQSKIKDAAIAGAKCAGVAVGWGALLGIAVVTMHKVAGAFGVEIE